jgi:hypothetical protein
MFKSRPMRLTGSLSPSMSFKPATIAINQLLRAVDQVEANTGKTPEQMLADGGYTMKDSNIEAMAERGIDLIGPVTETNSGASPQKRGIEPEFYPDKFDYDEARDTMSCPAGKALKRIRKEHEGRTNTVTKRQPRIVDRATASMLSEVFPTHRGAETGLSSSGRIPSDDADRASQATLSCTCSNRGVSSSVDQGETRFAPVPIDEVGRKFELRRFGLV